MSEKLERRVAALERALTDGEEPATDGESATNGEPLPERVDDLTDRVAELEAATQALRGYVGNVRSVNREVEQQAETALSKVERMERDRDGGPRAAPAGGRGGVTERGVAVDPEATPHDGPEREWCVHCGRPDDGGPSPGPAADGVARFADGDGDDGAAAGEPTGLERLTDLL
jgi:hypothetical protein